jgi:polyhydroxybutyrate depolymerase
MNPFAALRLARALILLALCGTGAVAMVRGAGVELTRRTWQVDGVEREGVLWLPSTASPGPSPVLFAFHGHGGSMRAAARTFGFHGLWPEAIVVYLQGLNTPGRLTDPEGRKPGWQHAAGDQGDRDLKLFDVVLAALRRGHAVDDKRIYATGHSNGGGFTYLLWQERGRELAAVAPSASAAARSRGALRPLPALHVAGERDPLVKFEWQQATIAAVLKLNQAGPGRAWEQAGTWHDSSVGAPTVVITHPGGHEFHAPSRAAIIAFFKTQARP